MGLKEYFDSINIEEIDRYVNEGQEENLTLEFKTVVHPNYNQHNREDDKKNISKTFSGFANSIGGIVVWGVKAKENFNKQDVATDKKPINELTKFLNILNRIEGEAVTPVIIGIEHKKIEIDNDCGFVVSYIPASDFAPHMANYSGKHYYKRSGDSFYTCEHYDIKDMFQRKYSAHLDLSIKDKIIRQVKVDTVRVELILSLINTGRNYAKAPLIKVEINEPFRFADYGLDGNGNIGVFDSRYRLSTPQIATYSGEQDVIIYPDLEYNIDKIQLEISKDIPDFPKLEVNYMIVAENMEKTNFRKIITVTK